jgi:polar amino acid transport system substrate-binding protein
MNRTTKAVTVLLTLVLAVTGCTSSGNTVGDRTTPAGGAPKPAGAAEVRTVEGSTTDTSCGDDPTVSLRPTGPPPGPDNLPPGSTMAAIRARGKLIVGVDQNTYQFGYRNPFTGEIEGFDLDMARAVATAIFGTPDAIQLRVLVSSQRVDALKNGDVDLVVQTMTINCARRKDIDFSAVYYQAGQRVLVKSDAPYQGIADLGGKKVCASKGSTSLTNIVNAPAKPIGVQVPGWTDCLVMLQQNQVEAVSTDDTILAGLKAQDQFTKIVGEPFTREPYGMGIPKGQADFVQFVNAVLDQMRANGEWTRIYNRWLASLIPGSTPAPPVARYRG